MMRNAKLFRKEIPVHNQLHLPQKASKSTPPPSFVHQSLLATCIKISHSGYECTQNDSLNDTQKVVHSANHFIPPIAASFSNHHFYKQPFWAHTRIILPLVQCNPIVIVRCFRSPYFRSLFLQAYPCGWGPRCGPHLVAVMAVELSHLIIQPSWVGLAFHVQAWPTNQC